MNASMHACSSDVIYSSSLLFRIAEPSNLPAVFTQRVRSWETETFWDVTDCLAFLPESLWWEGRGGGVAVNGTGEYCCGMCVCVRPHATNQTSTFTLHIAQSAAHAHTYVWNERITHTLQCTTQHTPFTCLCFIMIFIPYRWLTACLIWAFVCVCSSACHKLSKQRVDIGRFRKKKSSRKFNGNLIWKWFISTITEHGNYSMIMLWLKLGFMTVCTLLARSVWNDVFN